MVLIWFYRKDHALKARKPDFYSSFPTKWSGQWSLSLSFSPVELGKLLHCLMQRACFVTPVRRLVKRLGHWKAFANGTWHHDLTLWWLSPSKAGPRPQLLPTPNPQQSACTGMGLLHPTFKDFQTWMRFTEVIDLEFLHSKLFSIGYKQNSLSFSHPWSSALLWTWWDVKVMTSTSLASAHEGQQWLESHDPLSILGPLFNSFPGPLYTSPWGP